MKRIRFALWSLLTAAAMFWLKEEYWAYCELAWSRGHGAMCAEDWLHLRWFAPKPTTQAGPMGDWRFNPLPPNDWEVGKTYVARAESGDGRYWAKFVLTVTRKEFDEVAGDYIYGFTLDACLDGTPGFVDGWDEGVAEQKGNE
jgi:hypothetical protein